MAFSAIYELIEWLAAIISETGADDFLGTQGYEWDTQADMFWALIGGLIMLIFFRKYHDKLISLIKKWINSNHVYTARFRIRMLMNEFLNDDFKEEYLEWVSAKSGDDYYLKMMVAWFFSTALAKQYNITIKYRKM